jgi:hypothetical protein
MGALKGKSQAVVPAPTPTPVAVMPTPDTTSILQAKKKATDMAMQRAGRASTILSTPDDMSNGGTTADTFSSKTLG